MEYAAEHEGPVYIRLSGGLNCPVVYKEDYEFEAGRIKEITVDNGRVAVIATGLMVSESAKAIGLLAERGLSCDLYNMHTIKPVDKEKLDRIFKEYEMIVTVEEHNIIGGMGSAVSEYKAGFSDSPRQIFIGFNDCFADAGSQSYIWDQTGLTAEKIADRILMEYNK